MRNFISNKSFKVFVVALVILIVCSLVSTSTDSNIISSAIGTITVGMEKVSAAVTSDLHKKTYQELEDENALLTKQIADLRTQLVDYYDVKQENTRLWKYYDLKKENPKFSFLPASVIRRDPDDSFYSFSVDCGSSEGVEKNDPVVTENGLIGYVSSTSANSCKITTILSPEVQCGALDRKTADSGIVSGGSTYCDDNLTQLKQLSSENKIKVGDIIITTGVGGVYPADLVVGEVKDLKYDDYDNSQYAVIEPYEDIRTVTDVVIITSFSGQGEIDTNKKVTAETTASTSASTSASSSAQTDSTSAY